MIEEKVVRRWLADSPREHGFETELWTASLLGQLIQEEFDIRLHPRYLRVWLRDRGFTPQRATRCGRSRPPGRKTGLGRACQAGVRRIRSSTAASPPMRGPHWLRTVNAPLSAGDLRRLRHSVSRGRPFGDESWTTKTAERLGLKTCLRPRDRPKKAT